MKFQIILTTFDLFNSIKLNSLPVRMQILSRLFQIQKTPFLSIDSMSKFTVGLVVYYLLPSLGWILLRLANLTKATRRVQLRYQQTIWLHTQILKGYCTSVLWNVGSKIGCSQHFLGEKSAPPSDKMMQAAFDSSFEISYKSFTWVAMVDGWYLLALKHKCTRPEWGNGRWTLPILSNIKDPV